MAILINKNTNVLIQGITGEEGKKATKEMLDYGTNVVAGVRPGKGGEIVEGVPVYNSVKEALSDFPQINASVIYVPPKMGKIACIEAIENKIPLIVCITENIPIHDIAQIIARAKQNEVKLIGPSSIGIISPNESKIGSIGGKDNYSYMKGNVGIISKSGGMCSETALLLKKEGIGTSTVIGIGGDTISGSDFCDILELFEKDEETKVVVIYGEIGGEYEHLIAEKVINKEFTKPIVAFIAGKFAESLPQISLGHAGAIVEGKSSTRETKVLALKNAKIEVALVHHQILDLVKKYL